MIRYREILRLYSQGIQQTAIAQSCEVSTPGAAKVVQRAEEVGITWAPSRRTHDTSSCKSACFPSQICPRIASRRIIELFIKNWLKAALH